ncbi:MAG TPA: hypothetical protein VG389_01410 [Myxococcota bacterium]|nr:hypothetical protein [Myxococcota bacterium]
MRAQRWWRGLAALWLWGAGGCGGEKPEELPPECLDDELLADAFGTINASTLARVTVKNRTVGVDDGTGNVEVTALSTVSATFYDISGVDVEPAPTVAVPPSVACLGIVGIPVQTGSPAPLLVDSVTLSGGELDAPLALAPAMPGGSDGRWGTGALTDLVLGGPELALTIDVYSPGAAGAFPGFSLTLPTPADPVVTSPDMTSYVPMDRDLVARWEPGGNGDLMELSLRPVLPVGDTRVWQLLCYTRDDGCHRVPVEAVQWVTSIGATDYNFELTRHRLIVADVGTMPGDSVVVTLMSGSHLAPATP